VEQLRILAEEKEQVLGTEASAPVRARCDPALVRQGVVNLLDNAIKYTPAGGRVRLSVRREAGFAVLDVTDTGVGIAPEALPHVFKRFYRVDGSRSREQGGAGLGLAIVKSICTAHGAEVEVVSSPGQGSRFRMRQPLAGEAAARA
jgi:signal transduction histidine kinase